MPTWPAELPQLPLTRGYVEKSPFPVIQSPERGPQKSRLRYTAAPRPSSASFLLTTEEKDIFEAWHEGEIAFGAMPYEWHEWGDETRPVYQYRIVSEPEWVPAGIDWIVSLSLIRLP